MERIYYFAVTNACNRSCGPCCCFSRPGRQTYLDFEVYKDILPKKGNFEVQLEGGEPLLHPKLDDMIFYAQETKRCNKVILGTNGVLLPYQYLDGQLDNQNSVKAIFQFFIKYESPFLLKPSINNYLIEADPGHLDKAELIRDPLAKLKGEGRYDLRFNVRRNKRPQAEDDDQWLVDEVKRRGLDEVSNIFFFQKYGFASEWEELELPFIIKNPVEFHLIDPNGKDWGTDLIARSEGMRDME